jgi:hypothetical protein
MPFRPEPVAQSVTSLTADQKVWGSIPTQEKANCSYLVGSETLGPSSPISRDGYPRLPNHKRWVRTFNPKSLIVMFYSVNTKRKLVRRSAELNLRPYTDSASIGNLTR